MFEDFKQFEKIFVTGPQRSGTTICAKMIAHDTGHAYIDEIDHEAQAKAFEALLALNDGINCVIQCPAFCHIIHRYGDDHALVVLMRRPIDDIIRSQKRISWGDHVELSKYGLKEGIISAAKYAYFEQYQRHLIKHSKEVMYESLRPHPLWCDDRGYFASKQTEHSEEYRAYQIGE